jgi:hypothetical protein
MVLAEVVYDELQRMGVAPRQSVPAPPLPPPPSPAGGAAPSESGEPEG